jgi:hypothetical protein
MKYLKNFFWLCSGANKQLLDDCPTEASKYVGIGATVFFTGVFAALAGTYAMYTVFDSIWVATLAGLVWGAMIFNLDRYIVSSMRKKDTSLEEFKIAAPRIVLALLIALVISKPLELKIFEKEIGQELVSMQLENQQIKESLVRDKYGSELASLASDINALKSEIVQKASVRDSLRHRAQVEADGTGGTQRRNAGPIYKIKKADADQVELELRELTASNNQIINEKQARVLEINEQQKTEIAGLTVTDNSGLAGRLDALQRMTKKSSAIWLANWFIILLFIAIESAPVLVKLLSPKGPYDYALEAQEYRLQAGYLGDRAIVNKWMKKKAKAMPNYEKEFVDEQLEIGLAGGSKL